VIVILVIRCVGSFIVGGFAKQSQCSNLMWLLCSNSVPSLCSYCCCYTDHDVVVRALSSLFQHCHCCLHVSIIVLTAMLLSSQFYCCLDGLSLSAAAIIAVMLMSLF
jgi:hypothetical protein